MPGGFVIAGVARGVFALSLIVDGGCVIAGARSPVCVRLRFGPFTCSYRGVGGRGMFGIDRKSHVRVKYWAVSG